MEDDLRIFLFFWGIEKYCGDECDVFLKIFQGRGVA